MDPVGSVRLQLLQLLLCCLSILSGCLTHCGQHLRGRLNQIKSASTVNSQQSKHGLAFAAHLARTSRKRSICSKADRPSVLARTPDSAGPGVPAIVGDTADAPGVNVEGVTGSSASACSLRISSPRSVLLCSAGTKLIRTGGIGTRESVAAREASAPTARGEEGRAEGVP